MSADTNRIRIPFGRAAHLIGRWAWERIREQLRTVLVVVAYLLALQLFVLDVPLADAAGTAMGVMATILGLTLFLEGVLIGLMPLGERVGIRLPGKTALWALFAIVLVLGVTATLAEPAIGFLQQQGAQVLPWQDPLLFLLLNRGASWLVAAVAIGVGAAFVLGTMRFVLNWSFKPFVYILIPLLLIVTVVSDFSSQLNALTALAWDTGGITTGPVTVPIVVALGLGIQRNLRGSRGGATGLGVVTLASGLPVLAVVALGSLLLPHLPSASGVEEFYREENRGKALFLFNDKQDFLDYARQAEKTGLLSSLTLASLDYKEESEVAWRPPLASRSFLVRQVANAFQAVLPLALILGAVLLFVIREKINPLDEIFLGIVFAILGMFLFGLGMETGLSKIGSTTGENLTRLFKEVEKPDAAVVYENFDSERVFSVFDNSGKEHFYFWALEGDTVKAVAFDQENWNEELRTFTFIPVRKPIQFLGNGGGYLAILAIVFFLGLVVTLAEPSLLALGRTLEEASVGTYKAQYLVGTVAIGVGIGMVFGFSRILFHIPFTYLMVGLYALALVLTFGAKEDFAAIAWDSAGVTTGPVTVPLVVTFGLGLGQASSNQAAFGVLALASVLPIITVLVSGILRDKLLAARAKRFRRL